MKITTSKKNGKMINRMITRVAALRLGAPFSFVALTTEMATAPGQLTLESMHSILNQIPNPESKNRYQHSKI